MKTRLLWVICTVLVPTISAVGQSKRGVFEGVWQAVEVTHVGAQGATIKPGPNLAMFSARHYSRIDVQTDKPRPVLSDVATATAEQLREVWGPLVAEGGTYELNDNLITMRPIVSKNPAAMASGVSLIYAYKVEGNTVTLTAQRDLHGPVANPFTVKLVRIE